MAAAPAGMHDCKAMACALVNACLAPGQWSDERAFACRGAKGACGCQHALLSEERMSSTPAHVGATLLWSVDGQACRRVIRHG